MSKSTRNSREVLQRVAEGDLNVVNTLQHMIEGTFEASGLDPKTFMLVRMAALATVGAAPGSWLMNLEVSSSADLEPESVLGTLIAIAPVIGTARVVSAASNIIRASELAETFAQGNG